MKVKQLMKDLSHMDPDKEVVVATLPKGGHAGWTEQELAEGGGDTDSVEEMDHHVFIWMPR